MVNDRQVLRYRRQLQKGKKREAAAAAAGMTAKTARKWEDGTLPSNSKKPRTWRTRPDPLASVWAPIVVPLLEQDEAGELQATTILSVIQEKHGEENFPDGLLRTIQRRVLDWRAVWGPPKEVFFEQVHPPGKEAQVDFTNCNELGVTVAGQPFPHLIFEMLLSFSGWRFGEVFFSETYESLVEGTQGAFWELGGLTDDTRSDNLSAATFQLAEGGRKTTKRFQSFLDHYGMRYTRIRKGESNENGVVEKGHDVLKNALRQALIVRGGRDFVSEGAYRLFVKETIQRLNNKVAAALAEECQHLRPLPASRFPTYTDVEAQVRKWSTVRAGGNTYSVPSRLIGRKITVRLHSNLVQVLYRGRVVESFPRLRGRNQHRIDYRHIAHSLVSKPGAFAAYRFREELFPTLTFRQAYDALRGRRGERADVEYVRILHLAATNMEADVELALRLLLESNAAFEYGDVKALVEKAPPPSPELMHPLVPDLLDFDELLSGGRHAYAAAE